ncbi:MAG: amino acid permease [Bacteroidetes bacterium]|nr:amino acid permease [Bacteroidota bacterium]
MMNKTPADQPRSLRKSLGLFDATSIVVGSMIGSGIFIVSADMARTLGSPGWIMVIWLVTGILTIFAALSYGELAAMMPKAGGQYVYLREAYSPLFGFLYGWTLFLVIQTGTIAAVAMAFGKYMGVMIPWVSEGKIWADLGFVKLSTVHLIAIGSILILTFINSMGIKTGKVVQNLFTSSKVLALAVFIIFGLFFASNADAIRMNMDVLWEGQSVTGESVVSLIGIALVAALGTSMVGSLFSSDAWNNITFASAEVKNPTRNVPRSLFLGTLSVTVIYLLANMVYMVTLPVRGDPAGVDAFEKGMQFAVSDRVATASLDSVFGAYAALIMAVLVVVSTFGCNNGIILSGARVYYAMAQDRLFFKHVGKLNKQDVPGFALWFQGIWASLLCLSGTYSNLLDYVIMAVLIFYVLTILGIFILRVKRPQVERPYKAFGYPVIPAIYTICSILIMAALLIYKPDYTWPGLLIVLLGVPVYYVWKRESNQ